jgi:D-inositol-3-phosphate glycosyltransferase
MTETFNIAMISLHSCPLGQLGTRDTGGMNVYVRELARELGALGHRVDIYTRAHDPRDARMESPNPNVRLIHIQAGRVEDMGKMAQYEHLADFTANMADFVAEDGARYDIIHSHYWLSGEVGRRLAQTWQIPHVILFHTLGAIKNHLTVGEIEPAVRLSIEKELAHSCRRIIASTEREKGELARLYDAEPARIDIVPCGVNLNLFQPQDKATARQQLSLAPEKKIVLFVGRLEPLKGLENLIRATELLNIPEIKLLVIGGDDHSQPEVNRLTGLANELGIGRKIEFLGTVPQAELPAYYSAADISVVASYYESFCLVILESLACGTPVVSTRVGVAPAVIKAGLNGYLVEDNQPASLAQGIQAMLNHRSLPDRAELIRRSVTDFSWPTVAGFIAKEYCLAIGDMTDNQ